MNIFFLNKNIKQSCRENMDSHVRKIIIEIAQMMSTAYYYNYPGFKLPKKQVNHVYWPHIKSLDSFRIGNTYLPISNPNHGTAKWVRKSLENYRIAYEYAVELNEEYKRRWDKTNDHASLQVCKWCWENRFKYSLPFEQTVPTKIYLALPDDVKCTDPYESYRKYYIKYKRHLAKWTNTDTPKWYQRSDL